MSLFAAVLFAKYLTYV